MTVLLRLYLKLDSQAMTFCVQMPVLIFIHDGHTVRISWSQCCMHVCLTNFCIVHFLIFYSLVVSVYPL